MIYTNSDSVFTPMQLKKLKFSSALMFDHAVSSRYKGCTHVKFNIKANSFQHKTNRLLSFSFL